jgi:hypothetical protein
VVRFTQPPYGTLDAAEWAPSTASKADMTASNLDVRFVPIVLQNYFHDQTEQH